MFGLVNGYLLCDNGRLQQINNGILERNIPSQPLKPSFSPRPQLSKYNLMPVVNDSVSNREPFKQYNKFDVSTTFNPGTSAPWYGFANNINTETLLRNQYFALQDCDQADYVPGTHSSLYNNYNLDINKMNQPLSNNNLLFKSEEFHKFNADPCQLEKTLWNNHTKVEVRNL